jgi:hypothetical protein
MSTIKELRRCGRGVLDAFDCPKDDKSGMWLVYDQVTGAAFNWHALAPRLRELRAALRGVSRRGVDARIRELEAEVERLRGMVSDASVQEEKGHE